MSKLKKLLIANLILSFIVFAFIIFTIFKFNSFLNSKASNVHKRIVIRIKKNQPPRSIVKTLKEKGIISRSDWFYYYLKFTGLAPKIKAGLHMFYTDLTPKEVAKELISSNVYATKITIIPGLTAKKIALILKKKGFNSDAFLDIVDNKTIAKKLTGLNIVSLEGFLFPDTYFIARDEKMINLLKLLFSNYLKHLTKIKNSQKITKDDYKKLIIASIIQKEATDKNDMAVVASVIYNRLKKNMPLQMDSTKIYPDNSSFNTYTHKGLPPQPICNPGFDAIFAAYNPEKTNYLYFISKKDGSMVFSKTFKQHNINIRKYLK